MSATILSGKKCAEALYEQLKPQVARWNALGKTPHLVAVLVGDHPASKVYVRNKLRACERLGIQSSVRSLPENTTQETLLNLIQELNEDRTITGILVQLPLPEAIDSEAVIKAIAPEKDVDGFHPVNLGLLAAGTPAIVPATPWGIVRLLKFYRIETEGKHCVVVGRSRIVGRPLSILLSSKPWNATVTLCHSRTKNLADYTQQADILIVAAGKRHLIRSEHVKKDAVVIDVGIHRVEDASHKKGYRLTGDVDFDDVVDKVKAITPVPGGVGPMTVAALMENTLKAMEQQWSSH